MSTYPGYDSHTSSENCICVNNLNGCEAEFHNCGCKTDSDLCRLHFSPREKKPTPLNGKVNLDVDRREILQLD